MQPSKRHTANSHSYTLKRDHLDDSLEDQDELLPLHRKQPFGSGLKRKRVEFVRATDTSDQISSLVAAEKSGINIGDIYADIVFPKKQNEQSGIDPDSAGAGKDTAATDVCSTCSLPITTSIEVHNSSLAHQVSLQHSHPPSHLDRSRMGLRTLSARGWDPDARVGLGAEGEGMRFPIKVTPKEDTLGIGAVIPKNKQPETKPKPLTAKEVKARELREKRRAEKLQRDMYGNSDVDKHLKHREEWE